jgi:hypothetical protein
MTFDPRPYLDSIAQDIENEATFDCPATAAQRIRLAGQEIDRLRAQVAALKANDLTAEMWARAGDEIHRLRAENAALKANDPLAEMWRELAEYQPMADADGYGEAWAKMCSERTKQAARDAGFAAHAVAVGSRTQLAKLAAHDARDSTLFAGWASGNYVEGLKAVAEDCHSAIDAIRRAKEAKS